VKLDLDGSTQLRFILGRSTALQNQRSIATAWYRVTQFAFVGITDEWSASMCLFHRKLGGSYQSFEHEEVGAIRQSQPNVGRSKKRLRPGTADVKFFKCVALRFGSEVRTNDCAHYIAGKNYSDPYVNTLLNAAEL
jgi:hypothetical protein